MTRQSGSPPAHPRRRWRRAGRYAAWAAAVVLVLLTAVYVAARVYLPNVVARQAEIEQWLGDTLRHPVRLGRLEADWDGLNPGVRMWGATVYTKDGRSPAIHVGEVRVHVAPLPLLWGQVEIARLAIVRPSLALHRDADGRIHVVGLETAAPAKPGAGLGWLLSQPRLAVRDGELRWTDAQDPAHPLSVSRVALSLRNSGERHRLTASAAFPHTLCQECSLSADVAGTPGAGPWDGEIAVRMKALDVQALPLVLRERLPGEARGRFDAELWSDWRDGMPWLVRGKVAADAVQLPVGAARRPLAVRALSADVSWSMTAQGWQLDLTHLALGLTGRVWPAGRLRLQRKGAENLLELEHLELGDLTALMEGHQSEHPLLARWSALRPAGAVNNLNIKAHGALAAPSDYAFAADVAGLSTAVHERFPSVQGLSGRISFDASGGELALDSRDFTFHLPKVFRAPLAARHAGGRVVWRKGETAWRIAGADLSIQSEDGNGAGQFTLELPFDAAQSPMLRLRVDFRDGNGAHAARYYPAHRLPPRALEWMDSAFIDGRVASGYVVYDGPIRNFPFDGKPGKFELRARVEKGVYRYLPGWTPLTDVQADVAIDNADALVTGRGRIGALRAYDVRVEVKREPGAPHRVVRVHGKVDGPVAETVRVLQAIDSKRAAWRARVPTIARADGSGALDLEVYVPLRSERRASFLAAYRFQNAMLKLDNGTGLEGASGIVRFNEATLRDGDVRGQLFGGPFALAASSNDDELRVRASGRLQLAELLRRRGKIAERVRGGVDWSLDWLDRPSGAQLQFESDLRQMRSDLPPPLDRREAGNIDRLVVTTEASGPDELLLALNAGTALNGKLLLARAGSAWRLQRGRIDYGRASAALPPQGGLVLGWRVDAVHVDQWLPLLQQSESAAPLAVLTGISAEIGRLSMLNRDWGRTYLHFVRRGAEWRSVIDGDAAAGEGSFTPGSGKNAPRARLDLTYLRLPQRRDVEAAGEPPSDPRRLPTVELRARSFEYKQRQLGELTFAAVSQPQGWHIEGLSIARPETKLAVSGHWRRSGERETSDFTLELNSEDMGATLDAWGAEGQMAKGKVRVQARLSWLGSPTHPVLAGLNGNVEIAAEKGRFLRFDPGAARLFGLFDLRSLGRYLTLDFSPAFGKGYAFDAIHGAIVIERGNATTNNLIVKGPALNLGVNGRVGLAAEDYDLMLQASPRLSDTLTLTSWGLFGPQVAAAVLALQRIFRSQIQEGTRITYVVKGPWDNPTVTKLAKTHPPEAPPPTQQP